MKAAKILGIILVVFILVVGGVLFYATRYLQSPAFKATVLSRARSVVGAEVSIDGFDVSVLSGITLGNVKVANPAGFAGNLLTADAFVLRYRLLPLLSKRVEIEQLSLDKAVITLTRNARGDWNYEKIGGAGEPAEPATSSAPAGVPLDVTLSSLAMNHASVVMLDEAGKVLLSLDDVNLATSASLAGGKLSGNGKAGIKTVAVASSLFVRKLSAPVAISTDAVKLAPLDGSIAGGTVSGEAGLRLTGGTTYMADVQVKDADIAKMIEEAGVTKKVMTGKLQLTTKLEGTGGLPTIAGSGKASITGGQVAEIPLLNTLATLFQINALKSLKFTECVIEFTIKDNVMQTPVIRMIAPDVQITGKGSVSLADYSLNHTMTIAFTTNSLSATPKEIRSLFSPRKDGMLTMDFKVWGPYDSPKTDLTDRLVKGAANKLLEQFLK